jgi:ribonuclease HI
MSKSKSKYYVVWEGLKPGIYTSWEACKNQVVAVPGAKYKSYESRLEAEAAFKTGYKPASGKTNDSKKKVSISKSNIVYPSISVDAACSGNPGRMEYRGVDTHVGNEIFRQGPFDDGTNNIGEFLAIVHALALLKSKGKHSLPIYSDSKTAMGWVKKKHCNTKLERTGRNEILFEMIDRAEKWLKDNAFQNPLLKWETASWGEIPADFGRK